MARPKKAVKAKEPIRLRTKALSNGNQSLYLDYYQNGKREYEFLKLYLIPETTPQAKVANINTLNAANAIKAQRLIDITNGRAGIKTASRSLLLSDWIETLIKRKGNKASQTAIKALKRIQQHLSKYNATVMLIDVDKDFCIGFTDYLRTAPYLRYSKSNRTLSQTTQAEMFNMLSIVLNEAIRDGLINTNPTRQLSQMERIKTPESTREYLTLEEIQRLIETPVKANATHDKQAFLFCCFCGLRYSDVSALRWRDIITDGEKVLVNIIQKKTKHPVAFKLSKKALDYLPKRNGKSDDDRVFDLSVAQITNKRIKKWAKDAKINKNVTFHVSRHTFGTMMLTAGADLYVTSKLMGHTNIAATQIYAKIIDKKKEEAVDLLDNLF